MAVVGLRRAEEDVDLVEAVAQRERVSSPRSFGIEHARRATSSGSSIARQHLGGVGELRDHVGAHEARHLDAAAARCAPSCSISRTLSSVAIDLGLVLEAVARADLADPDDRGERAHR